MLRVKKVTLYLIFSNKSILAQPHTFWFPPPKRSPIERKFRVPFVAALWSMLNYDKQRLLK